MDHPAPRKHTLRLPATLLATLALLALPAAALARTAASHGTTHSCSSTPKASRHTHRKAKHACSKKHSSAKHHGTHKAPTPGTGSTAKVEIVPAACEDGTLPSHDGGSYSCEDGSLPACEEGTAVHATAGAPMCAVKPSSDEQCAREGGTSCATVEYGCEEEAGKACRASVEEEPEEPEEEE
jgi:hypothetical protein